MPSTSPAEDAPDRFIINTDQAGAVWSDTATALTPQRVRTVIREAKDNGKIGELYDLYELMEKTDTRYGGLAAQLTSAVSGSQFRYSIPDTASAGERQIAEDYLNVMREVICRLDQNSLVKAFAIPYFTGFKLFQLRWEMQHFAYGRKLWFPSELRMVPSKALHIQNNEQKPGFNQMMVRTKDKPEGILLDDIKRGAILALETEYAHGRYEAIGVARKCLPWYLGIQFVQGWWVQHIENYAAPLRIGRYPRGIGDTDQRNMERFLKMLGRHGYALFPTDMEVQLIEANHQGTVTTYQDFINKGHTEYAIAILGQANTVGDEGKGSYANGVISNSIRYEVLKEVGGLTRRGFDQLSDLVLSINYGSDYDPRLRPVIEPVIITPQEMNTKATVLQTLSSAGIPIPVEYAYGQVLGIAEPREGEQTLLHGKIYGFGVEPTPEPMQTQTPNGNGSDTGGESGRDRSGSNSVVEKS